MASQVTVSEAIASLQAMFPSYDEEVLRTLLSANNNQIEATIEAIFMMEGDIGSDTGSISTQEEYKPSTSGATAKTGDLLAFGTDEVALQGQRSKNSVANENFLGGSKDTDSSSSQVQNVGKAGAPSNVRRGVKVTLPEDFLRAPGWRDNNPTLGDEQLAVMLQNEMFQRQVAASMGDQFLESMRSGMGSRSSTTGRGVQGGRSSDSNTDANSSSSSSGGLSNTVPDMGILKGLSSMSEGARRNLNALAAKFETKGNTRSSVSSVPIGNGLDNFEDPSPRSNDRRGLLGQDEDDDEEEILFNTGNSGAARRHALDDRPPTHEL